MLEEVGKCVTRQEYEQLLARWRAPKRLGGGQSGQRQRKQLCVELALHKQRAQMLGDKEPELAGEIVALRTTLASTMPAKPSAQPAMTVADRSAG